LSLPFLSSLIFYKSHFTKDQGLCHWVATLGKPPLNSPSLINSSFRTSITQTPQTSLPFNSIPLLIFFFSPPFLFATHITDGIRFCSFFLSSKANLPIIRICPKNQLARAYGLATSQETKTPRRFQFRSIQRVTFPLFLFSLPTKISLLLDKNLLLKFFPLHLPRVPRLNANTALLQRQRLILILLWLPTLFNLLRNVPDSPPTTHLPIQIPLGIIFGTGQVPFSLPSLPGPLVSPACQSLGTHPLFIQQIIKLIHIFVLEDVTKKQVENNNRQVQQIKRKRKI